MMVVEAATALDQIAFKPGDGVRFDRNCLMAFERIEQESARRYLLEDVPELPLSAVGGQSAHLENLLSVLTVILVQPTRAAAYGLTGRNSVLLCGPPGCGKTLMARAAVSEIARITGKRCRFAVVKPAEWESPFVGETRPTSGNSSKCCARPARMASPCCSWTKSNPSAAFAAGRFRSTRTSSWPRCWLNWTVSPTAKMSRSFAQQTARTCLTPRFTSG